MKKFLLGLVMVGIVSVGAHAQSKKVTELTADTAPTSDDLVMTVNDPAGTAANRKVTLANLFFALAPLSYCADAGSTDAYACSLSPAPAAYVTGNVYRFKANTANTGAATINLNSIAAVAIKKAVGGVTTDLVTGDIRANQIVVLSYDGTNMQMLSASGAELTGDVTSVGGSVTTIANSAVTTAKMASKSGNGTTVGTTSGSTSNGKCLEWDANGNIVTAASNAACGSGSGTVTASSTDTFTHKAYDAEDTGNSLTQAFKIWFPAAGCANTTAASFWDLPTSTPAVAACVTGTNTQKGVLTFADTSGGFSAQNSMLLPSDFSGTVDARIIWKTTATSGTAKFSLSTICTAVDASETDDAAFNTASTVTTAAAGTASRLQTSSITTVTITGCAAGEFLHFKLFRDGNDGSDTLSASLDVIGVELTIRRAQ